MDAVDAKPSSWVWLYGDPNPFGCALKPDQITTRIAAAEGDKAPFVFIPQPDGEEARVRPHAITAISPAREDDV